MGPHRVMFVLFDGAKMLDVTGPAEVLATANAQGARYELSYASVGGLDVSTSIGTRFAVDLPLEALGAADTVIVSGGDALPISPIPPPLIGAIAGLDPEKQRVVSICTGAFILAAAGLLHGRRATTHWRHASLLARSYREIEVIPDALFVEDRGVHTSAGVAAGIDLALALVERDHSADAARDVARDLVMFLQRPGGQSQFSTALSGPAPRTSLVRGTADRITADPGADHDVATLARHAGLSMRHFSRLFTHELGRTPAEFVQSVRIERAKALLDAGCDVTGAARNAGFGSLETMRRAFTQRLGLSPSEYRARFGSAVARNRAR